MRLFPGREAHATTPDEAACARRCAGRCHLRGPPRSDSRGLETRPKAVGIAGRAKAEGTPVRNVLLVFESG